MEGFHSQVAVFGAGAIALGALAPALLMRGTDVTFIARRPFLVTEHGTLSYTLTREGGAKNRVTGFSVANWKCPHHVLRNAPLWLTAMGRRPLESFLPHLRSLAARYQPQHVVFCENLPLGSRPVIEPELHGSGTTFYVSANFNIMARDCDPDGKIIGVRAYCPITPIKVHAYSNAPPDCPFAETDALHLVDDYDFYERLKISMQLHCLDGAFFLARARGHTSLREATTDVWYSKAVASAIEASIMRLSSDFPNYRAEIEAQATLLLDLILVRPTEDCIERNCRNAVQKLGREERFLLPLNDASRLGLALDSPATILSAVLHRIADGRNKRFACYSKLRAFINSFSVVSGLSADLKSLLAHNFSRFR